MSDYTKTTNFAAKDALASGNAGKVIKGTEIDDEFNNIATAVATKFDSAGDLPTATTTTVGVFELATSAEATALSANNKYITPSLLNDVLVANAGMLKDIQGLADPNANRILFWDDSAGSIALLAPNNSLSISGTNFNVTSGSGIDTTSGVAINLSALPQFDASDLAAGDEILIADATDDSVKAMRYDAAGVRVGTIASTSDTLSSADMNRHNRYTAATAVTVTLNTGVGIVGNQIAIEQGGAGQVTIAGTATVNAPIGLKTRTQYSVLVLTCVATDTWTLSGDAVA